MKSGWYFHCLEYEFLINTVGTFNIHLSVTLNFTMSGGADKSLNKICPVLGRTLFNSTCGKQYFDSYITGVYAK